MRPTRSRRRAAAATALAVVAGSTVALAVPAAGAAPHTFYAYATGTGSTAGCPASTDVATQCSLTAALAQAVGGDTIVLATPRGTAHYVGNWQVSTSGTSPSEPLTITAPSGPSTDGAPILDGNSASSSGCTTDTCDGAILNIHSASVTVDGVEFDNADNSGTGGAILTGGEEAGGTVVVRDSAFVGDKAGSGGAISNGFYGDGRLEVVDSLFLFDTADYGGAISNGLYTPSPSLGSTSTTVTGSVFAANQATEDGGAIMSGGATTVVDGSSFLSNSAADGGALYTGPTLDPDHPGGPVSTTVTRSTFNENGASSGGGAMTFDAGRSSVLGSTLVGDTAPDGPEIDNAASLVVAGDLMAGSCRSSKATIDDGHNAAVDTSCLAGGAGDTVSAAVGSDLQQPSNDNSPVTTIALTAKSPAIGLVPNGATAPHAPVAVRSLCARTDAAGHRTAPGSACDAGAVDLPAPLRPTLSIAGGAHVAAGSKHSLTGHTRAGATVRLERAGTTLTTTVAGKRGTYAFTRSLSHSGTFTVVADHQRTDLPVTAVRLTIGVSGRQPLRKGTHTITGHAPAHRTVVLLRDGHAIAHTTAGSKDGYRFSLRLTETHRYRIESDGVSSATVRIRVAPH